MMDEKNNQHSTRQPQKEDESKGDYRKEKARADAYLNLVGGIIVAMDREGNVTLVNKAGEKMLGYAMGELVGKDWFDHCVPSGIRADVRGVFKKLVFGEIEPVEYYENPVVTRDGKERLIAWHNTILRDDEGRIDGTLSSGLDITEYRQAETSLRKQANVMKALNEIVTVCNEATGFHELLYNALDSVLDLLDLDGGGIYLIDEPNKSGTLACYRGLPVDFIETAMVANLEGGLNKDLLSHKPIFIEHAMDTKPEMARRWGFQSIASVPLVSKGRLVGVLNIVSRSRASISDEDREILSLLSKDVGTALDRTMAESNLKNSEERYKDAYELASFYKDLFAHDMNNILQSIISVAELHDLYKDQPEKVGKLENVTGTIKFHAHRGAKLVSNVRKLSMLDENVIPLVPKNLDGILAESVKGILKGHPSKKISVKMLGLSGEKVLANDFLIDVFDNLLDNAAKYTDGESVNIEVEISRVAVDKDPRVRITFVDRGIGISDDVKNTLFQKERKKGPNQRGMGMGLSLVKKIMSKLGGTIQVEDRVPGDYAQGSKFVVLMRPAS